MVPYGPARALEDRETFKIFVHTHVYQQSFLFDLHLAFFDGFNAFFRFLAEIRLRTIVKLPRKPILEPKRAVLVPPAPCLKLQSETLEYSKPS